MEPSFFKKDSQASIGKSSDSNQNGGMKKYNTISSFSDRSPPKKNGNHNFEEVIDYEFTYRTFEELKCISEIQDKCQIKKELKILFEDS